MVDDIPNVTEVLDQVKGLTELMSKYGALFVILSIFLVLFVIIIIFIIMSINKNNKTNTENYQLMLNNMLMQNKELLGELREEAKNVEQSLPKPHSPDLVSTYIDINLALKNICKSILTTNKCDRVAIYVFHNGNSSLHGLPFFKMSCIGEWNSRGVGMGKVHSDLPLHIFSDMVETLYSSCECFIPNIWDMASNEHSRHIKEEMQSFVNNSRVKGVGVYPIKDADCNLAGFTIIQFVDKVSYTDEEISGFKKAITEQNKIIGDIIIDSNIKKKIEL